MRVFHGSFAYFVIVWNLAVGLWGLGFVRRKPPAPRSFWAAILVGQGAVAAEAVTGVIFIQQLGRTPAFHVFYGFVVLIAAALSWTLKGNNPKRAVLVMSLVALFIGAVSIRGFTVASR